MKYFGYNEIVKRGRFWNMVIVVVGYVLSPLSWWNDLFVNLPIAYLIGSLFGFISQKLFMPFMIVTYWLTNILGLVMMHFGGERLAERSDDQCKRKIWMNIAISLLYTIVVIILIQLNILRFPTEYLK